MFDDLDRIPPATPPSPPNWSAVDAPSGFGPPQPGTGNQLRRRPRSPRGFGLGIAVGAFAMGTFALGSAAGVALTWSQQTQQVTSPTPVTPVGVEVGTSSPASVHELVTTARPSIVSIHTEITETNVFGQSGVGQAAGTGWVLASDGLIVTNAHVVDGANSIDVSFDDGSTVAATLVGADQRSDLAVLQVERTGLTPLPVGDSDAIQVGDGVVAIGNALDLGDEPTVTGGMVSAKDRSITEPTGAALVNLIQTDAAISPGNSGGPLLDLNGRVIGINTAISGEGQNIGFAIAINPAMDFIGELRNGQAPDHALLGVTSAATSDGSPGAVVTDVVPGSSAADAGVQPGDTISTLDGEVVSDPGDLAAEIARHRVGDSVTINVTRNGQEVALTATLGAIDPTSS